MDEWLGLNMMVATETRVVGGGEGGRWSMGELKSVGRVGVETG